MFWRIITKTLIRQKSKMIMIAFTVVLGVSLSTAMMNVMLGVGDKVNRELKVYGANITVRHKDAALMSDLYGLEGQGVNDKFLYEDDVLKLKSIFWGFNILDFSPMLDGRAAMNGEDVQIVGTWPEKNATLPTGEELHTGLKSLRTWWEVSGEWLGENDDDAVMLGHLLATQNDIHAGDKITLTAGSQSKTFTVKGIFNDGGNSDSKILMTLPAAQSLLNLTGKVSTIEVSALTTPDNDLARKAAQDPRSLSPDEYETWYCTAYVSAICHQIQEVIRDGVAKPVRQVAESEGTILNKTTLLMVLITILSSIGSALAISNLITASVIERSQELGLLKALGAYNWQIVLLVLAEVMITGLAGGVVGYFMGIGFAQVIGQTVFGSYIEIARMVILIVAVILFFVTLAGSVPAIRYLTALKPTEVLHGK
ncbi:MAG: ABC transporter permease [Synergistaceae bacterium]|nr:ABC transporter permease [Synergistaceae bacterium]MBQ6417516.1 ABC transporter permease [Synergistaceae bacterium]MBQ6664879.1 ABC transporter permease [Synergistaceae bacterium]MBQ6981402.1 ABC transporter permease [Synergistaceae bacterium]